MTIRQLLVAAALLGALVALHALMGPRFVLLSSGVDATDNGGAVVVRMDTWTGQTWIMSPFGKVESLKDGKARLFADWTPIEH